MNAFFSHGGRRRKITAPAFRSISSPWMPVLLMAFGFQSFAGEIQFNRDIRSLISENCLACHGPDPEARKAGLRLDTREGLFEKTDDRPPVVVPENLEESELWYRISTTDDNDLMPPPDSHKELDAEQKELIRQWIVAGAPWEGHWAWIPPQRPEVPEVDGRVENPIDAFIHQKLQENGLTMNSEADRRSLARRLSLDLTGLPPSPGEVEAFVNDESPDYYERYVDELMSRPQWGEHRGRYWLDAARYADTHGLHFDNYREMWPYRDWVIDAFNENKPFDEFTVEQLAGDLLDNPTMDQKIATGFQRCNITTNEGGTIEEENLANYANDRVTTTGWVFMGVTANCAACHDHKFDPLTQKDFYSLAAFYRNTEQTGFDRNWGEGDVYMVAPRGEHDRDRWDQLPEDIFSAEVREKLREQYADAALEEWVEKMNRWNRAERLETAPLLGDEYLRLPMDSPELEGRLLDTAFVPEWTEPSDKTEAGPLGPAPVLDAEHTLNLGDAGDFEQTEPFSASAWIYLPEDFDGEGSIVARMHGSEENHRGWDFFVSKEQFGVHLVHRWSNVAMKARTDNVLKKGEWQHVAFNYGGTTRADGVTFYLNGRELPARGEQNRLEGTIRVDLPLRIGRRESGSEVDGIAIQDLRIFRRELLAEEAHALAVAPEIGRMVKERDVTFDKLAKAETELAALKENAAEAEAAFKEQEKKGASDEAAKTKLEELKQARNTAVQARDEKQKEVDRLNWDLAGIRHYFEATQFIPTTAAHQNLMALKTEKQRIRGRSPVAHIQKEKKDSKPTAHILNRGQYDQPGKEVAAATPEFLPPMPENAPQNRLGLAQWIVSPENPLTARVTVNRFWQQLFGTGLVKTVEDFGVVGEPPVNQELLDWLAVEFIESGWDVKHMFRLMVTSAAYRQKADISPEKLEKDPENRLLSRGPRFRMDAEMIRDYALAASGLLKTKIGGPSVKPYQPEGVWEAVAMPESNTRQYERGDGSDLYRRSMYTFWKRAAPPATMDVFNAPSREVCTVRRERTNTPLQALATLNDPQFVEAARVLAEGAWKRAEGNMDAAIHDMARRLLLRSLRDNENRIVNETLNEMQAYYSEHPEDAESLIGVGEREADPAVPAPDLAALTLVANQLMNLDEVLNK